MVKEVASVPFEDAALALGRAVGGMYIPERLRDMGLYLPEISNASYCCFYTELTDIAKS